MPDIYSAEFTVKRTVTWAADACEGHPIYRATKGDTRVGHYPGPLSAFLPPLPNDTRVRVTVEVLEAGTWPQECINGYHEQRSGLALHKHRPMFPQPKHDVDSVPRALRFPRRRRVLEAVADLRYKIGLQSTTARHATD